MVARRKAARQAEDDLRAKITHGWIVVATSALMDGRDSQMHRSRAKA